MSAHPQLSYTFDLKNNIQNARSIDCWASAYFEFPFFKFSTILRGDERPASGPLATGADGFVVAALDEDDIGIIDVVMVLSRSLTSGWLTLLSILWPFLG